MRIDGGCHCGFITYQGEADPEKVAVCHCTDCQRLSGSAFRTVVPVDSQTFRMSGQPTIYVKTAESGNKREQSFCPRCGSPIYSAPPGAGPRMLFIRVGTINQRDQFIPKTQVWARSRQRWMDELAGVRKVEKQELSGLPTQR
jgi:hypothetical protein